jgi:hypothetical protein
MAECYGGRLIRPRCKAFVAIPVFFCALASRICVMTCRAFYIFFLLKAEIVSIW